MHGKVQVKATGTNSGLERLGLDSMASLKIASIRGTYQVLL